MKTEQVKVENSIASGDRDPKKTETFRRTVNTGEVIGHGVLNDEARTTRDNLTRVRGVYVYDPADKTWYEKTLYPSF